MSDADRLDRRKNWFLFFVVCQVCHTVITQPVNVNIMVFPQRTFMMCIRRKCNVLTAQFQKTA